MEDAAISRQRSSDSDQPRQTDQGPSPRSDGAKGVIPRDRFESADAPMIESIAKRIVELLRTDLRDVLSFADAATLADELGVTRDWVYSNAEKLGGIRLGGPRGRLRFDRAVTRERLAAWSIRSDEKRSRSDGKGKDRRRGGPSTPQAKVESALKRRRAGGDAPARTPRHHQTGGNPDDEAWPAP